MNEDDLEMVLKWRNSNHIRQYAISQEIISLQTHKKWFENLANKGDLYFIIEYKNIAVGLIWANKFYNDSCETGMYIYEKDIQNSLFAYRASLTLNEYLFNEKKLNTISCEILNENSRSSRYTLSLGYKEVSKDNRVTKYSLSKEAFELQFEKIAKLLNKSSEK
jgi:RimJ/RimL family protein N-acetyltransferase